MSRIVIVILIYYRHEPIHLIDDIPAFKIVCRQLIDGLSGSLICLETQKFATSFTKPRRKIHFQSLRLT
jgi:hypothetical protein